MKKLVLAAILALSMNGCVSVWGTASQPSPYIGVRLSCMFLVERWPYSAGDWILAVLDVLDLPPCAVVDTLLLPLTIGISAQ